MVESVSRSGPPVARDAGAPAAGTRGSGNPVPPVQPAAALAQRTAGGAVIVDLSRTAQLLRAGLPDGEGGILGRGGEVEVRAGEGTAAARDGQDPAASFLIEDRKDGIGVVPGFARARAGGDAAAEAAAQALARRRRRFWITAATVSLLALAFLLDYGI